MFHPKMEWPSSESFNQRDTQDRPAPCSFSRPLSARCPNTFQILPPAFSVNRLSSPSGWAGLLWPSNSKPGTSGSRLSCAGAAEAEGGKGDISGGSPQKRHKKGGTALGVTKSSTSLASLSPVERQASGVAFLCLARSIMQCGMEVLKGLQLEVTPLSTITPLAPGSCPPPPASP